MAEGHGRDAWGRMSVLCALIGNAHRDLKNGRAFRPSHFDPFGPAPGEMIEVNQESIGLLKEAFAAR